MTMIGNIIYFTQVTSFILLYRSHRFFFFLRYVLLYFTILREESQRKGETGLPRASLTEWWWWWLELGQLEARKELGRSWCAIGLQVTKTWTMFLCCPRPSTGSTRWDAHTTGRDLAWDAMTLAQVVAVLQN